MRDGRGITYFHADHLGSTSVARNPDGSTSTQKYFPFGGVRATSGTMPTDYGYTGQRADDYIKLVQMGSRWYDPELGRFIQADTIIPQAGNP